MLPRVVITVLVLAALLSATLAARHRAKTRFTQRPAVHSSASNFSSFSSFSAPYHAAARPKDPVEVQKQFCLTLQPEAAIEGPNVSKVPVTFNDLTFSMFCYQQHDGVSDNILSGGSWEASTGTMILETLAKARSKTGVPKEEAIFLDIGANIGWYSLLLTAAGYPVISFEPMQANERLFRRSICSNPGFEQQLTYHTDMLSDTPHTNCTMFSQENNFGDGTVSCDQDLHMETGYQVRETGLDMTTLDIALTDLNHSVFMVKMDVEGHEGHVFRGAIRTILQAKVPYIMFEFSYAWSKRTGGRPQELLELLVIAGYQFSFHAFHEATFDPLVHYADPAAQDVSETEDLPNIFCVHENMLGSTE